MQKTLLWQTLVPQTHVENSCPANTFARKHVSKIIVQNTSVLQEHERQTVAQQILVRQTLVRKTLMQQTLVRQTSVR